MRLLPAITILLLALVSPAHAQTVFPAPEDAARSLVAALQAGDDKALLALFGAQAKPLLGSDRSARERFVKAAGEAMRVEAVDGAKSILRVGKEEWPFPIPLVKAASGWRFDAKAGREELVNRRIGRNELAVIEVLGAYVDAQREYYLRNPQNEKLLQYAQRLNSTKGRRDGLYWPAKADEKPSPLGPLLAGVQPGDQYHGYFYRILRAQGRDAPGGAYSYLAQGRMIGGFALVAWPASYGASGVMTFIVNHDGVVYEKDLGPETPALAAKITRFNPDKTWRKAP
jgi:hypothetical protein